MTLHQVHTTSNRVGSERRHCVHNIMLVSIIPLNGTNSHPSHQTEGDYTDPTPVLIVSYDVSVQVHLYSSPSMELHRRQQTDTAAGKKEYKNN